MTCVLLSVLPQAAHVGKVVVRAPLLQALPVSSHGMVVITGGLGSMGLLMARWLLQQGIKHLHLVGSAELTLLVC